MARIVVVDDNSETRYALERILGHFGYAVSVYNGVGPALAGEGTFMAADLIVSDVEMRPSAGILLGALEHYGSLVPVVIVTGDLGVSRAGVLASHRNVKAIVHKPFGLDEILSTVESVIA